MDYLTVFDIGVSGMNLQMARLESMAANLANTNSTSADASSVYRPLDVVGVSGTNFESLLNGSASSDELAVRYQVVESNVGPRMVLDPSHPHANADGLVAYPDINPVSEMMKLMTATRAYEANAQVVNAAKSMASVAMDIGRGR